jgi:hypothetical protein
LPEDKAKVGAFNDKIQVLPRDEPFTNNRDRLIRIVKGEPRLRLSDALWGRGRREHGRSGGRGGQARGPRCSPTATIAQAGRGATTSSIARREKDMMIYAIGHAERLLQRPVEGADSSGSRA